MKRGRYIFAAGVVSAAMAMSIPVYADRSGKVELPQDSTDYYMTVDSGGVGVDIYPETSGKSEKLNDKTVEDGTVLHIEGETEKNGESWGYTEYNGTHGYVPLDELRPSKEDEIAAESVGVNTTKIKVIAFVFGAMTASIAGSLQAGFIGSVVPKDYTFINSINVLIIVVFGGLGSITGTIVAAIVLGILNMVLQNVASIRMIIYSLALILVMIFRPGGLLGTWELSLSRFFKKDKEVN